MSDKDTFKEVLIMLIAGIFVFLVLTGVVIFIVVFYQKKRFQHQQQLLQIQSSVQQELLKTQLETQEATFRQIGQELHDNVGQLLSSTKILLAITERKLPEVPDTLKIAGETLAKAILDLRSLSKSLNKEWLEQFNIIDNLQAETDRINAARTIVVQLHRSGNSLPLPTTEQIMLFRIVQEALQNCIKHAEPQGIDIHIGSGPGCIEVKILDNGKGFEPEAVNMHGLGLLNMEHRTRLLGGTIAWQSLPGQGTAVHIVLPVKNEII